VIVVAAFAGPVLTVARVWVTKLGIPAGVREMGLAGGILLPLQGGQGGVDGHARWADGEWFYVRRGVGPCGETGGGATMPNMLKARDLLQTGMDAASNKPAASRLSGVHPEVPSDDKPSYNTNQVRSQAICPTTFRRT